MSTTLAPPTPVAAPTAAEEDAIFTIPGLSWDQYVAINDALGDRGSLRVLYLAGRLTFVSPASIHAEGEESLDTIIKAIALGCGRPLRAIGSTTLRRAGVAAGVEGDKVYYLDDNVAKIRGVRMLDLDVHPTPDLAIEVENTHNATDALAIYAQLGVPEVWRHDVRRGTMTFGLLGADGTYTAAPSSLAFPFLTPEDVLDQVRRADEIRSYTEWAGPLADWVRDVIRPRLDPA